MPLWIITLVGVVIVAFFLRGISTAVWRSGRQLEQKLDQLTASTVALTEAVSALTDEISEQLAAIQRLLKPAAYVAESQIQSIEAEHMAEVSKRVDHLTEAVEEVKLAALRQEIQESCDDEQWKRRDAEAQAKVRMEKELTKTQRRIEQSQRAANQPKS